MKQTTFLILTFLCLSFTHATYADEDYAQPNGSDCSLTCSDGSTASCNAPAGGYCEVNSDNLGRDVIDCFNNNAAIVDSAACILDEDDASDSSEEPSHFFPSMQELDCDLFLELQEDIEYCAQALSCCTSRTQCHSFPITQDLDCSLLLELQKDIDSNN